jgi:integrase
MSFGKRRADNPCKGIERHYEEKRERYLSQQELADLMEVLRTWPDQQVADAIRLLLLTGARRDEIGHAEWSQFDLQLGRWIKPSSHTKQKRKHELQLSAPTVALLVKMRKALALDEKYLFPSSRQPGQPIGHLSHVFPKIARAAGLVGFRLHDLRHSNASILISGGATLALVGRMLGHTNPATTARYSHFFREPLQEAAEKVGSVVTAAERKTAAEVTPLPRRAK